MLPKITLPAQQDDTATGWRIEFTEGPNVGASIALPRGRHRLGRADSNDLVLADPLVADEQAELQVGAGGIALHALSDGLVLRRRDLRCGTSARLRTGVELRVGTTCMRVHGPAGTERKAALRAIALAPVAVLLVLGAALAAHRMTAPDTAAVSQAAVHALQRTPSVAAAAEALRRQLGTASLAGIRVTVEDGAVVATGTVGDRETWRGAQAWFDGTYAGRLVLLDRTGVPPQAEEMPRLDLRAVSAGAVPYLILTDGSRLTEGAVLRNGWTVVRIALDRVVLQRSGRTVDIGL